MPSFPISDRILNQNSKRIPGGMSSLNRLTNPNIVFVKGSGSRLTDADGNEYIDYHGAFAPHLLGHSHPAVNQAVKAVLDEGCSLFGSGPTELEGRLADLICSHLPWIEQVVFLNSGSEATAQAIRLARAVTRKDHIIVAQGGYNGWHNDVACNLATPLEALGPRRSPGEYDVHPMSSGIPAEHLQLLHPINFNDPESVRYVCERYPVGALITEPILQNVGLIKPLQGYLQELRSLANEYGFLLIFDEVKTGFRCGIGGYTQVSGVLPDLVVYGKAIASGYPLAAIGGPCRLMQRFVDPDPASRVLLAGTYNAHPVPVAAAIATIEVLSQDHGETYRRLESLSSRLQTGLEDIFASGPVNATVVREGSAFVVYFMDHAPRDWHDLAAHHDYPADHAFRQFMIENGIFFFPLETKQCSVSAAHTEEDIDLTLEVARRAVKTLLAGGLRRDRAAAGNRHSASAPRENSSIRFSVPPSVPR
ncbi:MAG: aspartate aminotransferase family protein [Bryobacteraceae bacterium]